MLYLDPEIVLNVQVWQEIVYCGNLKANKELAKETFI